MVTGNKETIVFNLVGYSQVLPFGMDGGTRIFVEIAKRWLQKKVKIHIFTCREGEKIYRENGLSQASYKIWPSFQPQKINIAAVYFLRAIIGIIKALSVKLEEKSIIYSGSDFWPDAFPAFFLKLKNPSCKWIAGFYLFAPVPWQKTNSYQGWLFLKGLFYWLSQQPVYWLIKKAGDMVWVTSKPDAEKFSGKKVVVVKGGVDLSLYRETNGSPRKKYDSVFVGRLHPQKGVLGLVDIWKKVVARKPKARLALIGNGPLENDLRIMIKKLRLEKNVKLYGFRDGPPKIKILKSSKIILHPAIYDSGGMAAIEGLAAGLPGVSFDLKALKTYYPQGVVKVPCFSHDLFASEILKLINNKTYYQKISRKAKKLAKSWDWDKRASYLWGKIEKAFYEKNRSPSSLSARPQ